MRLATVSRTSFRWRSTANLVIESTLSPRQYGVTWARASAESRPETNRAEQRILNVQATRQLYGSLGGKPGWANADAIGVASTSPRVAAQNLIGMNGPG